jgi:hypothetical protein
MAWADLTGLKLDMNLTGEDETLDARLTQALDAAMSFVRGVRPEFNYDEQADSDLRDVPDSVVLGTYRLAARLHARRRSPDAVIDAGELGSSRVPSFDVDIDRLLGIGRFRKSLFA